MKKALKWLGIGLGGVLMLLILAGAAMYTLGGSKIHEMVDVQGEALAITADSAALAHGQYIAATHGCMDCHGENLAGQVFIDAPPFLVIASNLTPAGVGGQYTDADWERAIRHGVGSDGQGLAPMMPAKAYNNLSDDETAALIAYLRTLPPVDNELPATEIRPLGRVIAATGGLPLAHAGIDHAKPHKAAAPPYGPTVEYGAYRAAICGYCHGADLHGSPPLEPGAPAPPDLISVTGWTLDDFVHAMRTGVTPSGKEMDPQQMPWMAFRNMTDVELEALHKYLSTLTPAES
jgi:cytochrome c553